MQRHAASPTAQSAIDQHDVVDMLRQRVYGLALGREYLNDHQALRQDVAMQTAVGVHDYIASAPTLCRLEKWADKTTAWKLHQVLVEQFIASFATAPEELVLDLLMPLTTRCTASRRAASFMATTTPYCYLPLRVCGQQLL